MYFFCVATLISFVLRQIVHNILFKVPTFSKKKTRREQSQKRQKQNHTKKYEANNRNGNSAFLF